MNIIITLAIVTVSLMIVFSEDIAAIILLTIRKEKDSDISEDEDIPISYEAFVGMEADLLSKLPVEIREKIIGGDKV
jgi:hypothetical protein